MILTLPYGTFERADSDDPFQNDIASTGFWDKDLQPFLDMVKPGELVVDVGAHIGLYTGYWANRGCVVVAFEGHPTFLPLLAHNVLHNGWQRQVQIIPFFLYSRHCWLQEHVQHPTQASNTWVPVPENGQRRPGTVVEADTLDSCDVGSDPKLLKVDAQGADLHVLLGAERLIQRCHPNILIEYEAPLTKQHGHSAEDYERWITAHRYKKTPVNGWNAYLTWEG